MKREKIFEVLLNHGRYSDFLEEFKTVSKSNRSAYSLFMNSHMLHEYHTNENFKKIVENADYICPDGTPLLYSLNLLKGLKSERIAGNDIIFSMVEMAEINQLKIFFYGSTDKVLGLISDKIKRDYPKLTFKTFSPAFGKFDDSDLREHSKIINDFGTNILLVGLGCPKQETRMHQFRDNVNALMLGVGGAFLLFAGLDTRAPAWMRKLSLEWLYRLALEPKRLFKRYLITNTYFCWLFVKELFKRK